MKKLILLFFLLPIFAFAQQNKTYNNLEVRDRLDVGGVTTFNSSVSFLQGISLSSITGTLSGTTTFTNLTINGLAKYDAIVNNVISDDTLSNDSVTITWTAGNIQSLQLDDTAKIGFVNPTGPCHITLIINHDSTTNTYPITWPTIKWEGGVEFTATDSLEAVDIIGILFDGTNFYASDGNDYK